MISAGLNQGQLGVEMYHLSGRDEHVLLYRARALTSIGMIGNAEYRDSDSLKARMVG